MRLIAELIGWCFVVMMVSATWVFVTLMIEVYKEIKKEDNTKVLWLQEHLNRRSKWYE